MADEDLPRSPAEAKRIGSPFYFTGRACPKGHISIRSAYNAGCKACNLESRREKYRCDGVYRQRRLDGNAQYVERNKTSVRAKRGEWYRNNLDHVLAKSKINSARWRAENPDKNAAKTRRRRAIKLAAPGSHTLEDIAAIRKAQRDKCACCRMKLHGGGEVDHIKSLKRGGSNHRSNLQLLCEFCNRSKGAKDPIDFMREKGRLL